MARTSDILYTLFDKQQWLTGKYHDSRITISWNEIIGRYNEICVPICQLVIRSLIVKLCLSVMLCKGILFQLILSINWKQTYYVVIEKANPDNALFAFNYE